MNPAALYLEVEFAAFERARAEVQRLRLISQRRRRRWYRANRGRRMVTPGLLWTPAEQEALYAASAVVQRVMPLESVSRRWMFELIEDRADGMAAVRWPAPFEDDDMDHPSWSAPY